MTLFDKISKAISEEMDSLITLCFHQLMDKHKLSDTKSNYEYLNGEMWYYGHPLENRMTDQERACLNEAKQLAQVIGKHPQRIVCQNTGFSK
jgi:hypothetical protein